MVDVPCASFPVSVGKRHDGGFTGCVGPVEKAVLIKGCCYSVLQLHGVLRPGKAQLILTAIMRCTQLTTTYTKMPNNAGLLTGSMATRYSKNKLNQYRQRYATKCRAVAGIRVSLGDKVKCYYTSMFMYLPISALGCIVFVSWGARHTILIAKEWVQTGRECLSNMNMGVNLALTLIVL